MATGLIIYPPWKFNLALMTQKTVKKRAKSIARFFDRLNFEFKF